jgi:hypothetical protein
MNLTSYEPILAKGTGMNIVKLAEDNYYKWSYEMEMMLKVKELWNCCQLTPGEYIESLEKFKIKEETLDTKIIKFREDNERCLAFIGLSVTEKYYGTVKSSTSAKEVWNKLKEETGATNLHYVLSLKFQFYTCTMEEKETLTKFVDKVVMIVDKLKELGFNTEEREVCFKILSHLPERYKTVSLTCTGHADLSISFLRQQFMMIEKSNSNIQHTNSKKNIDATGLNTVTKRQNNKQETRSCHKCGIKGHLAKECRAPQWKIENFQKSKTDEKGKEKKKEAKTYNAVSLNTFAKKELKDNYWFIDSGCSHHMTNRKELLLNARPSSAKISGPMNDDAEAELEGEIKLNCLVNQKEIEIILKDVLYIPQIQRNLISVSKMSANGAKVLFIKDSCKVLVDQQQVMIANLNEEGLYLVNETVEEKACVNNANQDNGTLFEWHNRLGHLSKDSLIQLEDNKMLENFKMIERNDELKCEICSKGKHMRRKFSNTSKLEKNPGDLIHTDICGPISPTGLNGEKYFISFIDDATRYSVVYTIQKKSEALDKFKHFKTLLFTQKKIKVKKIRCDGGGEYVSDKFKEYLKKHGIIQIITPPNTPQWNGVAERFNRVIMDKARCMMKGRSVDKQFWGEAVMTANFLRNRSPTSKLGNVTPYEKLHKIKPNLNNLKTFGCKVQFWNHKEHKQKLDDRSFDGILLGFDVATKCYRVYNIEKKKIKLSRDVKFYEDQEMKLPESNQVVIPEEIFLEEDHLEEEHSREEDQKPEENQPEEIPKIREINETEENIIQGEGSKFQIGDEVEHEFSKGKYYFQKYSGRIQGINNTNKTYEVKFSDGQIIKDMKENELTIPTEKLRRIENRGNACAVVVNQIKEPRTWKEMIESPEKDEWEKAIEDEIKSLKEMKTWEVVSKLPDKKSSTKSKWIFKLKQRPDGTIDRFKARLVAQGFTQKEGIDYQETFAPVVRYETIRYLLSYATERNLPVIHMDVETAFLHGDIEEEVYLELPPNFQESEKLVKLKKTIYGLKQSPREWNKKITRYLTKSGFKRSDADPCLFVRNNNEIEVIAIYVDDCILIAKEENLPKLKQVLSEEFKMKDMGEMKVIVGIQVERNKEETRIFQTNYIQNMLIQFGMEDCKGSDTPLAIVTDRSQVNQDLSKFEDVTKYREVIGKLNYLSTCTRPDISYAVSQVSRAMQDPTQEDWKNAKRIMRYLKKTMDTKIIFKNLKEELQGYSDASYAADKKDRKSHSGYVFTMNGGPISWKSKKQPIVALSSMEAEYIALSEAAKEALWLKKLKDDLQENRNILTIYEDNQSCIKTASDVIRNERSKHIDVRFHFLRELVESKEIQITYCPTQQMIADMLTKSLGNIAHQRHAKRLLVISNR